MKLVRSKGFYIGILLGAALLSNGCTSIALNGATAFYDRYNLTHQLNNQQLLFEINANIQDNPAFKGSSIQATCFDYQVLLTGTALTQEVRIKAADLAANTHDVEHVYNFITVAPKATAGDILYDAYITAHIKGRIIVGAKMDPDQLKVVTEKQTVYLMGNLTRKQAKLAVEIARNMKGVKRVVKIFKYVSYSRS